MKRLRCAGHRIATSGLALSAVQGGAARSVLPITSTSPLAPPTTSAAVVGDRGGGGGMAIGYWRTSAPERTSNISSVVP